MNIAENPDNITKQKTLKIPVYLLDKIEKDMKKEERDFTKQIIYIVKKYYEIREI
jgi:hypothetical protein